MEGEAYGVYGFFLREGMFILCLMVYFVGCYERMQMRFRLQSTMLSPFVVKMI